MSKFRVPFYIKLIDLYLKIPVLIDLAFVLLIIVGKSILINKGYIKEFDPQVLKSLTSDLLSVSISLAGFVLAALTIIVTFKDSVGTQKVNKDESKSSSTTINGKNLFFQSRHYFPTVKIFYRSSLILLLIFFLLSILKLLNDKVCENISENIVISCLILIVLTVLRSLYLLLLIIKLQTEDFNKSESV